MARVALGDYGPWTLVGIFVLSVFFGYLVPRWLHRERIRDKDQLIARLTAALDHRDEQFDKLITQGEVTIKLLEDLKRASNQVPGELRRT